VERAGEAATELPPSVAGSLTDDERATLVEWIDLGAPCNGIAAPDTDRGTEGGSR
jgi:hypothetical protein